MSLRNADLCFFALGSLMESSGPTWRARFGRREWVCGVGAALAENILVIYAKALLEVDQNSLIIVQVFRMSMLERLAICCS